MLELLQHYKQARTIAGVSFDGSANISLNTSNVTEDSGYLYYTDARGNSAIDTRVNKAFVDALNVVAASTTGNAGSATVLANGQDNSRGELLMDPQILH